MSCRYAEHGDKLVASEALDGAAVVFGRRAKLVQGARRQRAVPLRVELCFHVELGIEHGRCRAAFAQVDGARRLYHGRVERRILPQDRRLERTQRGPRLDPELLHEPPPSRAVDGQCLSLAPGAIEGEHQLAVQPLAERICGDELLEPWDDLGMPPELELGRDELLLRRGA